MGKMKTTTIVIYVMTVLCFFALPARARYSDGTGDVSNPFQINTPADLNEISDYSGDWDKYFVLTSDINMVGYSYTTAVIGSSATPFSGSFDGVDFVISNLTIDTAGAGNDYLGLFGKISGSIAEVKNLGIEDVNITGGDNSRYLGGLVGNNDGTISGCYSTGLVTGGDGSRSLGGLCGENGYGGSIADCYATGSVTGYGRIGGLCGRNRFNGIISNCYATGSVTGGDSYSFGGLVGGNDGTISDCYSTGSVAGGDNSRLIGGLCGTNNGGDIADCYSTGFVTGGDGSYRVGGLCGENGATYSGSISNCYSTGDVISNAGSSDVGGLCGYVKGGSSISNCYSTGSVILGINSSYIGGFCGRTYSDVSDCFWDTDTQTGGVTIGIGYSASGIVTSVFGKTTVQMQTQSTFTSAGWDFLGETVNGTDDMWRMCIDGIDYPRLFGQFFAGDFICPDGVDLIDFAVFADTWSLSSGQTGYNEICDLIDDDVIDFSVIASSNSPASHISSSHCTISLILTGSISVSLTFKLSTAGNIKLSLSITILSGLLPPPIAII